MPTLSKLLQDVAAAVRANADELTDLDRAIGDGDHGANLRRGFDAVAELAPELDAMPPGEALQKAGMTLVMKVGGASGPLYGSLLMGIGKSLAGAPTTPAGAPAAGARGTTAMAGTASTAGAAVGTGTTETGTAAMAGTAAPTGATGVTGAAAPAPTGTKGATGTAVPTGATGTTEAAAPSAPPSPSEAADALQAGVDMVRRRGRSDVGDKTMLDVLVPVCEALRDAAAQSHPVDRILDDLSDAAGRGLESTRPLRACKGRASFLAERSVGHLDPGARSSQIIVDAACASLRGGS